MSLSNRSLSIICICLIPFLLYRCAQVVPLSGGPKDTKAPVLLSVTPENKSVNVPAKNTRIVFKFNEIVSAQTASQKMIINPLSEDLPDIRVTGKTMTVEFNKELLPNTTYFLQFGSSVTDIHEGNPASDLSYLFSTGPNIDTATISGGVKGALSRKEVGEVSILLYRNLNDSAFVKAKPDYMTKTDESGKYRITSLKEGTYQVIALADKNKNKLYDAGEAIGFLDNPLTIQQDSADFLISRAKAGTVFIKKKIQPAWGYNRYILNDTFPEAYALTLKEDETSKIAYETRNDTLEIYYKDIYDQPLEFVLKNGKIVFDTINLSVPSKVKVDSSLDKITGKFFFRFKKQVYGAKYDDVVLNFSLPVDSIDPAKCMLVSAKGKETQVFTSENKNDRNALVTTFLPRYERRLMNTLAPEQTYTLTFLPGSIQTFWNKFNTDTLKGQFRTYTADETGNLQVKVTPPDSLHLFILQVLDAKEHVVREYNALRSEQTVQFYNLTPGEYFLRLIEDDDANGKFSPGNPFKHQQPEAVWYNKNLLKILAGWDVESVWNTQQAEKK